MDKRFIEAIYKTDRTVFRIKDIGMLTGIRDADNLKASVNYYASKGVIRRIRKGIYVKNPYQIEELAGRIYSPSYISLETVLLKAGVIFQFSPVITAISYLSRTIDVDGTTIRYNKIKDPVLVESKGIVREDNVNIATPERAFLDRLYLSKEYYFDNISGLDIKTINIMMKIYNCKELEKRVRKVLRNV
jgi:hypothetical protein